MTRAQSHQTKTRWVGVDLQENEDTRLVVEAIEEDNPDVTVSHIPGLVKIQTSGELVIRRATVEEKMGREWETHEFQLNIVSYAGNISEWDDDKIIIKWEH
jgi:phenol/toluene 2-monooxygenase (NADH) P2/A2